MPLNRSRMAYLSIRLPSNYWQNTYTTYYGYMGWLQVGQFYIYTWIVADPLDWVFMGENGWDNIHIRGDGAVDTNNIDIAHVKVVHNYQTIVDTDTSITLYSSRRYASIASYIEDYVRDLLPDTVTDPFVLTAIDEYGQGGDKGYDVGTWSYNFPPYLQPRWWCSEFASWVARQNNVNLAGGASGGLRFPYRYGLTPVALQQPPYNYGTQYPNDIGVVHLKDWATVTSRALFYGDDSGVNNGPTQAEWTSLQYGVDQGDIVGQNNYTGQGHTLLFAGWYDGADLEPANFDSTRDCNMMWTIAGNETGAGPVLGRVNTHKFVVCRPTVSGGTLV